MCQGAAPLPEPSFLPAFRVLLPVGEAHVVEGFVDSIEEIFHALAQFEQFCLLFNRCRACGMHDFHEADEGFARCQT